MNCPTCGQELPPDKETREAVNAYDMGWRYCSRGETLDANGYKPGSVEFDQFVIGWKAADDYWKLQNESSKL